MPLGLLVAVTGVSGAGKSTLINQILYPALANKLTAPTWWAGTHGIQGLSGLDKVINIDQKAIGRTPRSNPATYTKVFDHIRDFFALLPEAGRAATARAVFPSTSRAAAAKPARATASSRWRCTFWPTSSCPAKPAGPALQRRHLAGALQGPFHRRRPGPFRAPGRASCSQNHPAIRQILDTLMEVGLGYIKLGQSATTLSGGEAQRIKLARELAKNNTGRTLYILDEPTTGLHFPISACCWPCCSAWWTGGNTVVVIEHNLDVIKTADWIIDLGPEGGTARRRPHRGRRPARSALGRKKKCRSGCGLLDLPGQPSPWGVVRRLCVGKENLCIGDNAISHCARKSDRRTRRGGQFQLNAPAGRRSCPRPGSSIIF
jgi:excinuclease ABC subunit A